MTRITALLLALLAFAATVSPAAAQDGAAERVAAATDAFRVAMPFGSRIDTQPASVSRIGRS